MPVTTFSWRPSTQRMPGIWSSAATKCISLVPGLAKQVSMPEASRVRTRLAAPFMGGVPWRLEMLRRAPLIAQRSQQVLQAVVVDLVHQREQAADLARRKAFAREPVEVVARQV